MAKTLLTQAETDKIDAILAQYDLIVKARDKAKDLLSALGTDREAVITNIRNSGPAAFEANIAPVTHAVNAYVDLSGGLKATDLDGYETLVQSNSFIADYKEKLGLANTAIAALNGITAQGIKAGTYLLEAVKALHGAATGAYNAFHDVGGNNTAVHPNLLGFSKIALVNDEIMAYQAYKAFYDEFKLTWESSLDETADLDNDEVDNMESAYNTLSIKSKDLLDAPERKAIEDAILANQKPIVGVASRSNTAQNVILLIENILLVLAVAATIVYIVKHKNAKKKEDEAKKSK